MKKHTELPLLVDDQNLYLIEEDLRQRREEMDDFLQGLDYMNSRDFSHDVLFSHEVQANNLIEGYKDDVELVNNVIYHRLQIKDEERKNRILNLYRGYKYILEGKEINRETVRKLYSILSKDLLSEEDRANMGRYYRKNPVYIYLSGVLNNELENFSDMRSFLAYVRELYGEATVKKYSRMYSMGVHPDKVNEYMSRLYDYMKTEDSLSTGSKTDIFLKSQIMHFYFVYIHPYYDINGRTARTTSMWYLLNKEAYPFIIFNRGISLNKQEYYRIITDVKRYKNVSFFLNYMMENVRTELEKEHVMDMINSSVNGSLTSLDFQTLQYILSMKQTRTYLDFRSFYNSQNSESKPFEEIYENMLVPLLEKGVIIQGNKTHKSTPNGKENHFFEVNDKLYDKGSPKIKRLKL